ncbi:ribonuclease E inhibitor RraB [Priestia taiwanensis]|uniref:Regulator of ribonuclease activity B domain-containing protein n=1 Tax=Priestia taiwanensis TaxID=1347902 RepID=A0A917ET08_9BACI|nr:ribonuclease E inhibitor RraB [Priestia taiwanensis]MBM7365318.1 regulator of RNase E activity RraB [Priestia taiwanensis]GGE86098.1 hypothetical protein GCM10007140_39370 [Priestia taiwanensis]
MAETMEERRIREQQDIDTISALKEAGSDLKKEHYLEHYFVLNNSEAIEKIVGDLHVQGYDIYEPSEQTDEFGETIYLLVIGKPCVPTQENVWAETKKMTEIAITYWGSSNYYDGWEAAIEK